MINNIEKICSMFHPTPAVRVLTNYFTNMYKRKRKKKKEGVTRKSANVVSTA